MSKSRIFPRLINCILTMDRLYLNTSKYNFCTLVTFSSEAAKKLSTQSSHQICLFSHLHFQLPL